MESSTTLILTLSLATLAPFIIAAGTCYLKFSIVLVMTRNALGVQQVPSNMVLNAIALMMALFVMTPIAKNTYEYLIENPVDITSPDSFERFSDDALAEYKRYLYKYSEPELLDFFEQAQGNRPNGYGDQESIENSLLSLLPAYALSEIKSAFIIGFYLYLPFIVIDLVVSCILLALGMMMMSPITLSVPLKLILFIAMDGWTLLAKGLINQYLDLMAVR
ncbi:EscR/YscR/HrcR family type III secretion system export apparatus protein [Proteus cibarius]|uniref:EscR/YscR/HrcR family type III secretion system export apparatus protein n=1 Tax=Proteus terrae subsp. cibarius TaxID=626774 RepID=A0ABX6JW49_9GAMM|nr:MULTISPECIES: EscR/YscR/HrcR family type III secretion system export apparatus protein [Proteus]QHP77851.1 EscR/YscR/HrcR family type III secretion system export apparatus protein [Proteus vulgaris]MBG3091709.1 EscR/YscR/HrcR family type III secretion system export apparatus protein [Proteus terrae subsp. cibarius]MBG6038636.1 EscR/YscR/HrcR family type III secretion system export apparatus protein [Proteus terrae subsp. cibarius]MCM2368156.1 EscR/YscR/HrcR family type III secretion system e